MKWIQYIFIFFVYGASLRCAAEGVAVVKWSKNRVQVGDQVDLAVDLKNMPEVYGVQLSGSFDKNIIRPVANLQGESPTISLGEFLVDPDIFSAKNYIDGKTGDFELIQTLLKPAEPKSGRGRLLHIEFIAIASGDFSLEIDALKFGTQSGEVVNPELRPAEAHLNVAEKNQTSYIVGSHMLYIGLLLLGSVGFGVGWSKVLTRKVRKRAKNRQKALAMNYGEQIRP